MIPHCKLLLLLAVIETCSLALCGTFLRSRRNRKFGLSSQKEAAFYIYTYIYNMRANFPGLILIVVAVFQRGFAGEHSATQAEETSCSKGHCFVENEGPCKDDGQHKLYRWDPVKVSQSENLDDIINPS